MCIEARSALLILVIVAAAFLGTPAAFAKLDHDGGHGEAADHHHGDDGEEGHAHWSENWCGTNRSNLAIALGLSHRHHREQMRLERGDQDPLDKVAVNAPKAVQHGNIAVVSDGVFRQVNPVDVAGFAVLYTPKGKGYQVAATGAGLSSVLGTRLDLTDDARLLQFAGLKPSSSAGEDRMFSTPTETSPSAPRRPVHRARAAALPLRPGAHRGDVHRPQPRGRARGLGDLRQRDQGRRRRHLAERPRVRRRQPPQHLPDQDREERPRHRRLRRARHPRGGGGDRARRRRGLHPGRLP